jgi:D-alanyl-lipoteichoic acid acyltransferase DltB (MBOAT superfamily)
MFISYGFIAFLALLLILYYLIPRRFQWILLLAANFLFYFSAGTFYPLFILITSVTVWATGIMMLRCEDELRRYDERIASGAIEKPSREEKKAFRGKVNKRKKRWMMLCLFLNLGILAVAKYTNFAISNINGILQSAGGDGISYVNLIVPLGISFYTFQAVSYLLDVYWERSEAQKSLPRFILFVSFFPQLIQGPISRYGDLSKTLYEEHRFDWKTVRFGLERVLWGYFKKLVVADRIAVALSVLKSDPDYYTGGFVFAGMLFYAAQLYADFTGGIDITIGISQSLGIRVEENFIRPFFSKNITEYWRRWHISMGTWFRDYVFYPCSISHPLKSVTGWTKKHIGKKAAKRVSVYVTTILCWLATGIWHGAAWYYVVWGLLNGVIILVSQELEPLYAAFHRTFPKAQSSAFYRAFQVIRTFLLLCCLRLFDIYADVGLAFKQLLHMFTEFRPAQLLSVQEYLDLGLTGADYLIVLFGVLVMFAVSMMQRSGSVREKLAAKPYVIRYGAVMAMFFMTLMVGWYGFGFHSQQFIYNQF